MKNIMIFGYGKSMPAAEGIAMGGGYFDPVLVGMSYVVAVIASYTALKLAQRVSSAEGRSARTWLPAGAVAMGVGIWSMHFVGMLAFSMDMPFTYDVPLTLLSMGVGILSSAFAIFVASRKEVGGRRLLGSGLFLGFGIAGMHYTGMAAMDMEADLSYEPFLFVLSIVIAIVASIAALWIALNLTEQRPNVGRYQVGAAFVMGIAICGMHYTGMAAAIYTPHPGYVFDSSVPAPDNLWLAIAVSVATLVILVFTLLTIYFEKKTESGKSDRRRADAGRGRAHARPPAADREPPGEQRPARARDRRAPSDRVGELPVRAHSRRDDERNISFRRRDAAIRQRQPGRPRKSGLHTGRAPADDPPGSEARIDEGAVRGDDRAAENG